MHGNLMDLSDQIIQSNVLSLLSINRAGSGRIWSFSLFFFAVF
jgi:hypothetical protein